MRSSSPIRTTRRIPGRGGGWPGRASRSANGGSIPRPGIWIRRGWQPLLADGRVRLVCFPHCSNVVAEINPVAEIVAMAHAAGAVACVDGVSYAPHGLPDVGALGADIYLFSAYKVYGPHQGIMVIRRALGERLPNQGHWFNARYALQAVHALTLAYRRGHYCRSDSHFAQENG